MTQIHTYDQTKRVTRPKVIEKRITLTLPEGMLARVDQLLDEREPRLDMIREAIEREIKRRERLAAAGQKKP